MLDRKTGKAIRDSKPEILVTGSGKFKLLDRMLPQLIQEGHKVDVDPSKYLRFCNDFACLGFDFFADDGVVKFAGGLSLLQEL